MVSPILITLGSNIVPETNLPRAVRLLSERVIVRAVSRVYQTAPRDAQGKITTAQGYFLNAAAWIETDLPPAVLKAEVLRGIEAALGRVRTADKFAPRPIDLDLTIYGDQVIDDPAARLTLPDPDLLTRAHVALPLADLAPDFVHPITGTTLSMIAAPFIHQPDITIREDVSLSV